MRISDWSSDVCSSDLSIHKGKGATGMKNKSNQTTQALMNNPANLMPVKVSEIQRYRDQCKALTGKTIVPAMILHGELIHAHELGRSEERRVGNECDSTSRSRWSP